MLREAMQLLGPPPGETRSSDPLRRVRACGRIMANGQTATVEVERSEGRARYSGLAVCGSIHACPVCSAAIRHQRALDIEEACSRHLAAGGHLLMVTLTTRHHEGMRLAGLWDVLTNAMRHLRSGRAAKALNARLGLVGSIKAVEVTCGANGWHPHVHLLLFVRGGTSLASQVEDVLTSWTPRWIDAVVRQGYPAPEAPYALRVQPVTLSEVGTYLAKVQDGYGGTWGPSQEIARGDLKRSKGEHGRTPFGLLEAWVREGDVGDLLRWREWELASRGRRAIVWSNGLRAALGMDQHEHDDQAAAEGAGFEADPVYVLTVPEWRAILATRQQSQVLDAAELGGTRLVRLHLAELLDLKPDDLDCDRCEWSPEGLRTTPCRSCTSTLTAASERVRNAA